MWRADLEFDIVHRTGFNYQDAEERSSSTTSKTNKAKLGDVVLALHISQDSFGVLVDVQTEQERQSAKDYCTQLNVFVEAYERSLHLHEGLVSDLDASDLCKLTTVKTAGNDCLLAVVTAGQPKTSFSDEAEGVIIALSRMEDSS